MLVKQCEACFILSMICIFLYSFICIFLTFTIHNLYKVITDPIDGILRPTGRLRLYMLVSTIASLLVTALSYMSKVYGRSVSKNYKIIKKELLKILIK